jgi:hypothetical protein
MVSFGDNGRLEQSIGKNFRMKHLRGHMHGRVFGHDLPAMRIRHNSFLGHYFGYRFCLLGRANEGSQAAVIASGFFWRQGHEDVFSSCNRSGDGQFAGGGDSRSM